MTFEEAVRELGVQKDVDRDVARRAYLKLLKRHKPEVDPKGFARLREAWELVDQFLAHGHLEDAALWDDEDSDEHDVAHPFMPVPRRGADGDPLAEYRVRLDDLPGDADWSERASIAREAVASHPDDPAAHGLLVDSLTGAPDYEVVAALRAAANRGLHGFFETLIWSHADHAADAEIERAGEHSDVSLRLVAAAQLATRGRASKGAEVFRSVVRGAIEEGSPGPPAYFALEVLLALYAADDPESARAAGASYRDYLQQAERSEAPTGLLAATWALVQEFEALPADFPSSLRQGVVRALQTGDPDEATTAAQAFLMTTRGKRQAKKRKKELQVVAPNIAKILHLEPKRTSSEGWGHYWWILFIIVPLIRMGVRCAEEGDKDELAKPTPRLHAVSTVRQFEEARSDLLSVCKSAPSSPFCDQGRAARRALLEGRCEDALELLTDVELRFDGEPDSQRWADRGFAKLKELHLQLCTSHFKEP